MKIFVLSMIGIGWGMTPLNAGETIFGQEGSGRPTNTIVGTLFGAATGAAIGQATGGKDGWWIGSLVGSAVGGTLGNTLPTNGHYAAPRHSSYTTYSSGYKPRFTRSYYSTRSYCEPVVYRARPVVVERPVILEEAPVVIEKPTVIETDLAPYGFLQEGKIKSPWSDFSMSVGGLSSGQTVYDGLTGKAFRIP